MEQIDKKETDAGIMKVFEDNKNTRYEIHTHAWFYRGGKTYSADKVITIQQGKTVITMEIDNADIHKELTSTDEPYTIPAETPHIFYFPETTSMIEVFPKDTKSKNFERYRNMKK